MKKIKIGDLDKGPFSVVSGPNVDDIVIYSDDFHHDVCIKIYGDFEESRDKLAYAKALAAALNNAVTDCVSYHEAGASYIIKENNVNVEE